MAFPLTHLFVASSIAKVHKVSGLADFFLGSIAPDAVHFRKTFVGAGMAEIGHAKKISHLCPESDEKWGSVTDNDGWTKCVKSFLMRYDKSPIRLGFAVHVLTDIYNNKTLWSNFRTNNPDEAKKGYKSTYYDDLKHIDALLKSNRDVTEDICEKLAKAKSVGIEGVVSSEEVEAIKQSIISEYGANSQTGNIDNKYNTKFVSYDEMLIFIKEATLFASAIVF